jgi:aminoglycoside phosphotransferase (APT) family kinase protein
MSDPLRPDVTDGLAAFLTREWGPTEVTVVGESSAGARRRQVLFDAVTDGNTRPLVATIVPQAELIITDLSGEAETIRLAERAGVPVPHIHLYSTDEQWVGGPFFVGDRIAGESVPRRVLRSIPDDRTGEELAAECGRAMATLHRLDAIEAHPLMQRPTDINPAENSLTLFDEVLAALLRPMPVASLTMRWLRRNMPQTDRHVVLHGDFRNGNLIVDRGRLAAVLDWEGSHTGDPMADPAWFCVRTWRFGNDDKVAGGFGSLDALRDGYVGAGGTWDQARFDWWLLFGTLRWAAGLTTQGDSHVRREVRNIVMCASGRRVPELEWDTLQLLASLMDA